MTKIESGGMKMNCGKYIAKVRSEHSQRKVAALITATFLIMLFAPGGKAHGQRYSAWSAPVNLGQVINTTGFDGCPSVTQDGLTLLFMSTIGGIPQNIYYS